MDSFEDQPLHQTPADGVPPPAPSRGPDGATRLLIAAAVIVVIIAAVFLGRRWASRPEPAAAPSAAAEAPAAPSAPTTPPAVELPPLDRMDAFIRSLLSGLSPRPELARWLTTDDLTSHIAASIDQVARGLSPARDLKVIAPSRPFAVTKRNGRLYMADESSARYDGLANTAASIDVTAVARAYSTIKPRLNDIYGRLGRGGDLDQAVELALVTLLQTPLPEGPIELVPGRGNTYAFADPRLESLRPIQKQLLRMGTENARIVLEQVRALARALGVPDTRLPGA